MSELRRVYCRHCGQIFLSDDLEKCSACCQVGGMTKFTDAAALTEFVARKRAEPPPQVGTGLLVYRAIRLAMAGMIGLVLGLMLILVPFLRTDPNRISLDDVIRGLVTMLVGLVLIAAPFWVTLLRRK
jgi:hypothetical protein